MDMCEHVYGHVCGHVHTEMACGLTFRLLRGFVDLFFDAGVQFQWGTVWSPRRLGVEVRVEVPLRCPAVQAKMGEVGTR